MTQPKIEKTTIVHSTDTTPDFSYLETTYEKLPHGKLRIISSAQIDQAFADAHPRTALRYIKENAERMEEVNRGGVWQIGIYAKALVSYSVGQGNSRLETLQSGGLWGIESDSPADDIKEVEQEQLLDLKGHLTAFNVDVSNFDEKAKNADRLDE